MRSYRYHLKRGAESTPKMSCITHTPQTMDNVQHNIHIIFSMLHKNNLKQCHKNIRTVMHSELIISVSFMQSFIILYVNMKAFSQIRHFYITQYS
jgi:uncharacterized membrane protein